MPRGRKAKASLQNGAGGNELSEVNAAYSVDIVPRQLCLDIVPRLPDCLELLGNQ